MENNKIITNDIWDELFNVEQPGKFFHYTSIISIEKIIDGKSLRLSHNINLNANDLNDINPNNYILCFTTSSTESIPLWYLYTGVSADGVRLELTKKGIEKILSKELYYYEKKVKHYLSLDSFDILFKPVLYYEDFPTTDKGYEQFYRIKFNHNVFYTTKECIDKFKTEHSSFCKTMEWSYEKETRLNIHVKIDASNIEELYFDFDDLVNHISITLGPNFSNSYIKTKIEKLISKNKVVTSKLNGKVRINMCSKCKK